MSSKVKVKEYIQLLIQYSWRHRNVSLINSVRLNMNMNVFLSEVDRYKKSLTTNYRYIRSH